MVRIRETGAIWEIVAVAPDLRERSETVPRPVTAIEREEVALLAQSLVRELGSGDLPVLMPLPPPPPPEPEPVAIPRPVDAPAPPVVPPPVVAPASPDDADAPPDDAAGVPASVPEPSASDPSPPEPAPAPRPAPAPTGPPPVSSLLPDGSPDVSGPSEPQPTGTDVEPAVPVTLRRVEDVQVTVVPPPDPRPRPGFAVPTFHVGPAHSIRWATQVGIGFDVGVTPWQTRRFELTADAQVFAPVSIESLGPLSRSLLYGIGRVVAGLRLGRLTPQLGVGMGVHEYRQQYRHVKTLLVPQGVAGITMDTWRTRWLTVQLRAHTAIDLTPITWIDETGHASTQVPVTLVVSVPVRISGLGDPKRTVATSTR